MPPGHGDRFLIMFLHQVISMVRFEDPVMDQSMTFKRVTKFAEGLVHDVTMQGPFEHGCEDKGRSSSHGAPEKERNHEEGTKIGTETEMVNKKREVSR